MCPIMPSDISFFFLLLHLLCPAHGAAGEAITRFRAYVLPVCVFLPAQENGGGTLLAIPEEINRAPSADLRDYFRYSCSTV